MPESSSSNTTAVGHSLSSDLSSTNTPKHQSPGDSSSTDTVEGSSPAEEQSATYQSVEERDTNHKPTEEQNASSSHLTAINGVTDPALRPNASDYSSPKSQGPSAQHSWQDHNHVGQVLLPEETADEQAKLQRALDTIQEYQQRQWTEKKLPTGKLEAHVRDRILQNERDGKAKAEQSEREYR